uniref:Retrovirus-related Pol polyprotein from transposon TNT 1-94 n=1 Tax=Passalora fulva TaxID=5499 RepID=A0A9Q8PC75_PASFU
MLSQYLTKPTETHLKLADQCLRYLLETKNLCLVYGASKHITGLHSQPEHLGSNHEFFGASDASYGMNNDRTSSNGWVFMLFGGPVDYKASKQITVTKSLTEAELLGLSQAASELIQWERVFAEIHLQFNQRTHLYCDNTQTIRLVNQQGQKLDTKLRHVDIHHHWLRQRDQRGDIEIKYLSTNDMPTDGLTKLLPPQKHKHFVKLLNIAEEGVDPRTSVPSAAASGGNGPTDA